VVPDVSCFVRAKYSTFSFVPSLDAYDASKNLSLLIPTAPFSEKVDKKTESDIIKLNSLYKNYCRYAPPPWVSPHLAISNEAIRQSQLWLPMETIIPILLRFLRSAIAFHPILQGTDLIHGKSSWLEFSATFPPWLESKVNPAKLLRLLVADYHFRTKFIFWLFMPKRYYGSGANRYPGQIEFLRRWISSGLKKDGSGISILDAASGDGEAVYAYAGILHAAGFNSDVYRIEGWALDPLESWAAAHLKFYNNAAFETECRKKTAALFIEGVTNRIIFTHHDLLASSSAGDYDDRFDLIICNGLLFGPILNGENQLIQAICSLASKLKGGGVLLFADHFHDGWKKKFPATYINRILHESGLLPIDIPEGNGAIKKGAP